MSQGIWVKRTGGPEVMELGPLELPEPGAGQVRIAVRAAGVNFIDVYFRTGLYPRPLPFVAGLEGSGVVEALGQGVSGLSTGDRVAWSAIPGSYADAVIAPADRVVSVPDDVPDDVAAAAMLQGMTAHYLVNATRETRAGDVALVHAGAGGVGLLLTQLLVRAGARVITTCSNEEKAKLSHEAGAEHVIRYTDTDFTAELRRLTEGRGADVVYDSVGRTTFEGSLRSLRPRGLLVLYGQSSGPVPPFELQQLNDLGSLFVTRPSLVHYTQDRAELELRSGEVLGAIRAGQLDVRIGARFPLADAGASHRALEGRRTTGKVLLLT